MEYIVFIIALSLLAAVVVLLLTERQRLRLSQKKFTDAAFMGSLKGAIDDVLISDQLSVWQYDVATDCMNFLFGPFLVKEASCLD
ncbi:MAG: hypothetical protein PHP76_08115 [Bacteroidales bacterium]|nr:hypothetical protein [Bacteroidales bacterium]